MIKDAENTTFVTEQTPTVDAITADTTTDTPAPATLPKTIS